MLLAPAMPPIDTRRERCAHRECETVRTGLDNSMRRPACVGKAARRLPGGTRSPSETAAPSSRLQARPHPVRVRSEQMGQSRQSRLARTRHRRGRSRSIPHQCRNYGSLPSTTPVIVNNSGSVPGVHGRDRGKGTKAYYYFSGRLGERVPHLATFDARNLDWNGDFWGPTKGQD